MAQPILDIPKEYEDGSPYSEAIIDGQSAAIEQWALSTSNNLNQIIKDAFGTTYTLDNDGNANLATPLIDLMANLSENEVVTGSWNFNNDLSMVNGKDILFFSDNGSTLTAQIEGSAGSANFTGGLTVSSGSIITGGTTTDSLAVSAASTLTGAVVAQSTLVVTGATTLNSTLVVIGVSTLTGAVVAQSTLAVTGTTTLSSTLNVTDDVTFDTDTFFLDASQNNIGIGTITPTANASLHIVKTADTLPGIDSDTTLLLQNNSATGTECVFTMIAGTTALNSLFMGDSNSQSSGAIQYDNNVDFMRLATSDTIQWQIDQVGNLLHMSGTGFTFGQNGGRTIGFNAGDINIQNTVFKPASDTEMVTSQSVASSGHVIEGRNNHATYTGTIFSTSATRAANAAYSFYKAFSDNGAADDLEFRHSGDGNGTCDGAWTGGGADYAEMFETLSGAGIKDGLFVTIQGDKVKKAKSGDYIVGVVSNTPSFVADSGWNKWDRKYKKKELGGYDLDEKGNRQISEAFDPKMKYIARQDRDEWISVGMMGKLYVQVSEDITGDYVDVGNNGQAVNGTEYRVIEKVRDKTKSAKGYGVVRIIFK